MRKNQPPYALILLGNGFDIAHDFKTSYANFMDYLLEYTRNNNFACKASHLGYYIRKDKNFFNTYWGYIHPTSCISIRKEFITEVFDGIINDELFIYFISIFKTQNYEKKENYQTILIY